LISDERWQDKDAVLREIGSPVLLTPIKETLAVSTLNSKGKPRSSRQCLRFLGNQIRQRRQLEMAGHPVVNVVIKAHAQFLGGLVD